MHSLLFGRCLPAAIRNIITLFLLYYGNLYISNLGLPLEYHIPLGLCISQHPFHPLKGSGRLFEPHDRRVIIDGSIVRYPFLGLNYNQSALESVTTFQPTYNVAILNLELEVIPPTSQK